MIIPCGEIHEILKGCYTIEGKRILIKHSLYKGEREFAIALIEECMGLLSEKEINDKFVIQYLQGLISLATPHSKQYEMFCNGVQREHNKKLNNGLPILHKVPPKRDYGRYFCIMAEKGGTSHGGLTEKLSPFFHAKKQEVNAYGR